MEWKEIPGFYYEASDEGMIRHKIHKRSLSNFVVNSYLRTNISTKDGMRQESVHRLIALAFVANPENKPFVNHKDGNKLNNKASNLEWVSAKENIAHAWDAGLSTSDKIKQGMAFKRQNDPEGYAASIAKMAASKKGSVVLKKRKQLISSDGILFSSCREAAEYYHVGLHTISRVLRNQAKIENNITLNFFNKEKD